MFQFLLLATIVSFFLYTIWKDRKKEKDENERIEAEKAAASKVVSETAFHDPYIPDRDKLLNLHYMQLKKDKETIQKLSFNTEDLLLSELLQHVYGYFGYAIQSLTVVNKTIHEINDQSEIRSYKVLDAIISDKKFICDQAMLLIKYVNIDDFQNDRFIATLTLEAKEENEECLMVRATLSIPPIDRQGFHAVTHASTLMLSSDKMEKGQKQACFEYMLNEALNTKSEDLYTLDPVQLEMLSQHNPTPARDLFFGNKYFCDKRYYNALLHFEKAYEKLRPVFFELNDYGKKTFFDVCYKIGYCFCDMQNFSSAIYYLELADSQNIIQYTVEYVNALVNSGDIRTIYTIDRTLENVQKQISDAAVNGQEVDDDIVGFYNFLRRRKGYTLVDVGNLDMAEDLFKQMANEPANHDFAVNELKHIAVLREERKTQCNSSEDENKNT